MKMKQNLSTNSGFTVVVIAALFIAFAVIGAAMVERNTTLQQITKRDAARDQLQKLSNALIEYAVFNRSSGINLYPCPADPTVLASNSTFGSAIVGCYTDTGGNPGSPTGNANIIKLTGSSNEAIRGIVPVLELSSYGITVNDAFDPWNNRIMYVVNRLQTVGTSSTMPSMQTNNPKIYDKRTGYTLAAPDFILISYGRDRVGALSRADGSSEVVSCGAAETLARKENCDDDYYFITAPTYTAAGAATATDVGNPPTTTEFAYNTYFDDILTWYRQ